MAEKNLLISWHDCIPDTEVLKPAGMESIHAMQMRSQLRWVRHVVQMPDERLPKQLFYEELCRGKCSKGYQKKCYRDTLKVSLKCCCIDTNWEDLASDHPAWRSKFWSGVKHCKKQCISYAIQKYLQRKERQHKINHQPDRCCILVLDGFDNLQPWLD